MGWPRTGGIGSGAGFSLGPVDNIFGNVSGNAQTNPQLVTPAADLASSEGVRDAYFLANPTNLATYDAGGNENLGIILYYTDSGQNITQPQTRIGGEWRNNAAIVAIQGLPGSGTDFSNVSDNHIPAIGPGPNKVPFDSGLFVDANNDLVTPRSLQTGPGSVRIGPGFRLSNGVLSTAIRLSTGQLAIGLNVEYDETGSTKPFYYSLAPRTTLDVNLLSDVVITAPYNLNYTTFGNNLTEDFVFFPNEAGTIRLRYWLLTDSNAANFDETLDTVTNGMLFFEETREVTPAEAGNPTSFAIGNPYLLPIGTRVFVRSEGVDLRGTAIIDPASPFNGQNLLYFRSTIYPYTEIDFATYETLRNTHRRSTSLVINASNVELYQPFALIEFTNENGRPDLEIHDDVFDVGDTLIIKHWSNGANPGVGVRYEIDGGTIDGESDMILGQDSSIITRKVASNTWRIVASHDVDTTAMREMIQDVIGAMVSGNTETGITVTYADGNNDGTGKLNFVVADDSDTLPTPSLHGLSLDIASRVDLNTVLNGAHDVTFDVSNYAQLTALELIVNAGTNQTLTLPVSDGIQTQSVTLAGISTSAQGTVTFQLSGTHAGGTVTSNTVTIDVRNLQAQELTYVDFQADRLPASFTAAGASSAEFQQSQSLSIPTFTGSQYVVIGQPQNEDDITSLLIGGLDQLGTFEKVTGTTTIGGVVYEFYYSRNTLLGSVVSGVQLTINRG